MFTLNWGVVGLGGYAKTWINDVFDNYKEDPTLAADDDELHHVLKAVASTTSIEKAVKFAEQLNIPPEKVYGDYESLLKDPEIDIIYIASPIGVHYQQTLQALKHGKHVLCEKTFVITAQQALYLQKVARDAGLFLMEAMWTKFLPSTLKVLKLVLEDKIIGEIARVSADLSQIKPYDPANKMYRPELGGGASFDMLIYGLVWPAMLLLDRTKGTPKIHCSVLKVKQQPQLDVSVSVSLVFEDLDAIANSSTSMLVKSPEYAVRIEGTKGYLELDRSNRPGKGRIYRPDKESNALNAYTEEILDLEFPGRGCYFQVNAAARAIRDKKLDTEIHPMSSTVRMMEIFDIIRDQCGIEFPADLLACT